jgi:hypothetical protein
MVEIPSPNLKMHSIYIVTGDKIAISIVFHSRQKFDQIVRLAAEH